MKKYSLLPVILFALFLITGLSSGNIPGDETAIKQVLNAQVKAWNEGDLEAFMLTYWNSEELTYYSGGQPLHSWQALLARYRRTYQSKESEMGFLEFNSIEINLLGEGFALARGEWHLERKTLDNLGGVFTLILKKFPDGWKIIHDHSSSSR
jgi:ketosteroid isomerase-like protein